MMNIGNLLKRLKLGAAWAAGDGDPLGKWLGAGATVPINGTAGWRKCAIFFHYDGTGPEDLLYINNGTSASCAFVSFENALQTALASTANGAGASLIGVEDANAVLTAATVEAALAELALRSIGRTIADPGNGGAIPVTASGVCAMTTLGDGETRTLAIPTFVGQESVLVHSVDGGDVTVTAASAINVAGNTTMAFADVGDTIVLRGVGLGATRAWRVVANDGVVLG